MSEKQGRDPRATRRRRPATGQRGGVSDELRPYVDRHESDAIDRLGERLNRERPLAPAAFRSELRRRLASSPVGPATWHPRRLRLLVAACLASGLLLLGAAAIGLAGGGPLGY